MIFFPGCSRRCRRSEFWAELSAPLAPHPAPKSTAHTAAANIRLISTEAISEGGPSVSDRGIVSAVVTGTSLRYQSLDWWHRRSERQRLIAVWVPILLFAWYRFASISHGRTFQYDEWNFVINRWSFTLDTFLSPHNSHLSVVPATIFFILFRVVGLDNYGVYQAVGYLFHFLVTILVLLIAAKRVGLLAASALAVAFTLLGTGAENILWPFQIGSMGSSAGYLLALLALDGKSSRAPWLVCAGLCLSLGSAGFGVVAVAGVGLEVLLRRLDRRYWTAVVAPAVTWAVWSLIYGTSEMRRENLSFVGAYAHESYAGAVAAFVRAPLAWGFGVGWLLAVFIVVRLARSVGTEIRLIGLCVVVLSNWSLTALSRAQYWAPLSSRYVYVAAPILLLVMVELIRVIDRRSIVAVAVVFAAWSVTSTWESMSAHGRWLREWGEGVGMELRALDSRLDTSADDYRPDANRAPDISAGTYRRALTALGSTPAFDDAGAANASAAARIDMDRVLDELGAVSIETTDTAVSCRTESEVAGELRLQPGPQLVMLTAGPAEIGLRAYGDAVVATTRVQAPGDRALRITVDSRLPDEQWHLVLLTPDARACIGQ